MSTSVGFRVMATLVALAGVAHADVELANDGFVSGGTAVFQTGFAPGEMGAARFVAPAANQRLTSVQLLFGGGTATESVTLKVWDDTAGTDAPGAELLSADFALSGSNSSMQALDLTTVSLYVPAQFRIGIELHHAGAPSIAIDQDGGGMADKNYLYAGAAWQKANTLGVKGDWIIRAYVGAAGGDAGTSSCASNSDCPFGDYCNTSSHVCTYDCRVAADCNGGTCNNLGMCVGGATGDDSGGCQTERGGAGGGALLGLGALVILRRRKRSR